MADIGVVRRFSSLRRTVCTPRSSNLARLDFDQSTSRLGRLKPFPIMFNFRHER